MLLNFFPQQDVPYLKDLDRPCGSPNTVEPGEEKDFRQAWKSYLQACLPHAKQQIKNFLLASMAEGTNEQDDETANQRKGTSLYCNLTEEDIDKALQRGKNVKVHDAEVDVCNCLLYTSPSPRD